MPTQDAGRPPREGSSAPAAASGGGQSTVDFDKAERIASMIRPAWELGLSAADLEPQPEPAAAFSFGSFCFVNEFIDQFDLAVNEAFQHERDEKIAARQDDCKANHSNPPAFLNITYKHTDRYGQQKCRKSRKLSR